MNQQLVRVLGRLALDGRSAWIGGVCVSLARWFGMQPIYVRGGTVIATIFFPETVIISYILLWLLLHVSKKRDAGNG